MFVQNPDLARKNTGGAAADEREQSASKSARKRTKLKAAAEAAAAEAADAQVVNSSIILPALAVENLVAAHRFVRLVCIHTARTHLRGSDLSRDMLDEFKDEVHNLEKLLENPDQIPRLTSGSDTVAWLGRVRVFPWRTSSGLMPSPDHCLLLKQTSLILRAPTILSRKELRLT